MRFELTGLHICIEDAVPLRFGYLEMESWELFAWAGLQSW
jgi:hypothetical protein